MATTEAKVPADFVQRLLALSTYQGRPYGRLQALTDGVAQYRDDAGHCHATNAFKCFFFETIEESNRARLAGQGHQAHGWFILRMRNDFETICAAEVAARSGYPFHGMTLLRNAFDNLALTSAALQQFVPWLGVEGIDPDVMKPGQPLDMPSIKKRRKAIEHSARRQMTGEESRLSAETQHVLSDIDAVFDLETHGSRLSQGTALDWMHGRQPLSAVPQYSTESFSYYLCRHYEVSWIAHRLLPCFFPDPAHSRAEPSAEWQYKWTYIDQVLHGIAATLVSRSGCPVGQAMAEFVLRKVPFSSTSRFPQLA